MSFFKSISNTIYREYDRRIRRASEITEYGAHHHAHDEGDDHDAHDAAHDEAADDGEVAEILNVPRGTIVAPSLPEAGKSE